jgi:hypothetical protein
MFTRHLHIFSKPALSGVEGRRKPVALSGNKLLKRPEMGRYQNGSPAPFPAAETCEINPKAM